MVTRPPRQDFLIGALEGAAESTGRLADGGGRRGLAFGVDVPFLGGGGGGGMVDDIAI